MPLPTLTAEEKVIFESVTARRFGSPLCDPHLWGHLIAITFVTAFAFFGGNFLLLVVAPVVSCIFVFHQSWRDAYWAPHWRSLLLKLEAACVDQSPESDIDASGAAE